MPFENLVPYFRGARFALVAMAMRHPDVERFVADATQYAAMLERYEKAVIETHRLRRRQQASSPPV
jgi:hypothetical protein